MSKARIWDSQVSFVREPHCTVSYLARAWLVMLPYDSGKLAVWHHCQRRCLWAWSEVFIWLYFETSLFFSVGYWRMLMDCSINWHHDLKYHHEHQQAASQCFSSLWFSKEHMRVLSVPLTINMILDGHDAHIQYCKFWPWQLLSWKDYPLIWNRSSHTVWSLQYSFIKPCICCQVNWNWDYGTE